MRRLRTEKKNKKLKKKKKTKKKKKKKDSKVVPAIACKVACECRRLFPLVAAFKTSRETSQTAMN